MFELGKDGKSLRHSSKLNEKLGYPVVMKTWQLKNPLYMGFSGEIIHRREKIHCHVLITRGQILDRWFNIICLYSRIALEKTGGYVLASQQMQGVEDLARKHVFFRHGLGYLSENATILGNI